MIKTMAPPSWVYSLITGLVAALMCIMSGYSLWLAAFLAYMPSYFDGAHLTGVRAWPELQQWTALWRPLITGLIRAPVKVVSETTLDPQRQSIIAAAPHGILSLNHALYFTDAGGFLSMFPHDRRDLGASVIFRIPLFRELLLWAGCVDASKATARKMLKSGKSLFIYPGGEKEQMLTRNEQQRAYIRTRKGYARLALESGSDVIPAYCFGETDLFKVRLPLEGLRMFICDKLHIALPIATGVWGIPFPFCLPLRPRNGLYLAVGKPLRPSKQLAAEDPGFAEAVEELHERYLAAMVKLVEDHKHKSGYGADAPLELLPPAGKVI